MRSFAAALLVLASAAAARGDGACRLVEVSFQPAANLQVAVWIEDAARRYVDPASLTRATGALGLGNRPRHALLPSAHPPPPRPPAIVPPLPPHTRHHPHGSL